MAVTVADIVNNAKRIMQEVNPDGSVADEGVRWKNDEFGGWLNEFYQAAVQLKPDAYSVNEELLLNPGTKQSIPQSGLRLIDVVRNTATASNQMAVMVTTRRALDSTRRTWHSDPASTNIEHYVFDELDPTTFYVYPPADTGAALEIIYSAVPEPHDVSLGLDGVGADKFKLNDAYGPVALDYILYRAYAKDAEHAANLQRSQMHYQAYMQQLSGKAQTDQQISPNAPDVSANPQRTRA